jgi:3-phenylpropionate/cinnamic acid dioxygenase small subunit
VTAEAIDKVGRERTDMSVVGVPYPSVRGKRVPVTDPRHFEIVAFLEEESALLDNDELTEWLDLMAGDIVYRAPVRVTREHGCKGTFEKEMYHYNENSMTLMLKIMRLTQTNSAWSENPASRTHRIVHKVRAYETDQDGEYEVESSVVLLRSRYDEPSLEVLPARRVDIIRTGDPWEIAARTIYFDQATLGVQNLAVYL